MKISAHYQAVFAGLLFLTAIAFGYIESEYPKYLSNIEKGIVCLLCIVFITSNIIKLYRLWKTK